jgi:hypothetical protein
MVIANLAQLLLYDSHLGQRQPHLSSAYPLRYAVMLQTRSSKTPVGILLPPLLRPLSTPSTSSPFTQTLPLDIQYLPMLHNCISDVYIDDFITVGLALPHLLPRLLMAVVVAVHCIFCQVYPDESTTKAPPISI